MGPIGRGGGGIVSIGGQNVAAASKGFTLVAFVKEFPAA